ncbi:MAG: hypothetical protein JNJ91_12870 [Flavobacteriales bacterium]|nr:hypothetical protein [Flavobacteriales bacterium]
MRRLSLPGLTNPQNVLNGATEVRRTVQGHLLVTRGQEVRTLSAPNAPTVPAVLASMATNYTWSGGPYNPLQTNVALQPIIAHAEQGVAHRHLGRKHYELTDHLGNVRVVVSDVKLSSLDMNNEPHTFLAQVVSRTDYYAFGSPMPKRHVPGDMGGYRYRYQGSEADNEFRGESVTINTFYRSLDTRIGRWISLDPVVQPYQSPYCSMDNNPVVFNDPLGDKITGDRKARRAIRREARRTKKMAEYRKLKKAPEVREFRSSTGTEEGPSAECALYDASQDHKGRFDDKYTPVGGPYEVETRVKQQARIMWSISGKVEGTRKNVSKGHAGSAPIEIGMPLEWRASLYITGQREFPDVTYLVVNGTALQSRRMKLPLNTVSVKLSASYYPSPDVEVARRLWEEAGGDPYELSNEDAEARMSAHYSIHATSLRVPVLVPQGFLGMPAWRKAQKPAWATDDKFKIVR